MPTAEDLKLIHRVEPHPVQMVTVTARTADENRKIGDKVPMRPIKELERLSKITGQLLLEDAEYKELQLIAENEDATRMKEFINRAYNEAKRMRQEADESFKFIEELKKGFDRDAFENWTRDDHVLPDLKPTYKKFMELHEEQQRTQKLCKPYTPTD